VVLNRSQGILLNIIVYQLGGILVVCMHRWLAKSLEDKEPLLVRSLFRETAMKDMNPVWHAVPWLCAFANACFLILWKVGLSSIRFFYVYNLAFYTVTTVFSIFVYVYALWFYRIISASGSKYTIPISVDATLRLMVRVMVADATCNIGYVTCVMYDQSS
jgi:hypothetical protein